MDAKARTITIYETASGKSPFNEWFNGLGKSLGEAIRGFKKGLSDDEVEVEAHEAKKTPESLSAQNSKQNFNDEVISVAPKNTHKD